MLFPRFRSKERDARSDLARLEGVRAAIRHAIADAEQELYGLLRRLDEERARAAFLLDDLDDDEEEGEDSESRAIRDAEKFLVRGDRRRLELEDHLIFLRNDEASMTAEIHRLQPLDYLG